MKALVLHFSFLFFISSTPVLLAQTPNIFETHPNLLPFEFQESGQRAGYLHFHFQDSRGFVWGADELYRPMCFDGDRIEIFSHDPNDPTTASPGQIYGGGSRFFEDSEGKIWITYATGAYVDCFDPVTEKIQRFRPKMLEALGSKILRDVHIVNEDRQGRIWIGADRLLFRYDKGQDSFKVFSFSRAITLVFEDLAQNLWVHLRWQGMARINSETGAIEELIPYPKDSQPTSDSNWGRGHIDHFFQWRDRNSYLLVIKGLLYEFDLNNKVMVSRHTAPLSPSEKITSFCANNDQVLLATFSGRMLQYFPNENRFALSPFFSSFGEGKTSSYSKPFIYLKTRDGIIWTSATQLDGRDVNLRLFPQKLNLDRIPIPEEYKAINLNMIPGDFCFPLGGEVWFLTHPFLTPAFSDVRDRPKIDLSIPAVPELGVLTHQFTTDKNGHLWQVATYKWPSKALFIREFDPDGNFLENHAYYGPQEGAQSDFEATQAAWPKGFVNDIQFDQNGKLWVGVSYGGLFWYNPLDRSFRNFEADFEGEVANVIALRVDQENNIWCGGAFGLKKWDQVNETWTDFTETLHPDGTRVNSIAEDAEGRIWISSRTGIYAMDKKGTSIRRYGKEDYMYEGNVEAVFIDKYQQIWACAMDEFYLYDKIRDKFILWGAKEGGWIPYFTNPNAYFSDRDGNVFFLSTDSHVYRLRPEKMDLEVQRPDLYFKELRLFNKKIKPSAPDSILGKALDYTDQLQLQFAQNDFTIHYTSPEYAHPDKLEFFIRMKGFNDTWQNVGNKREARYTNLSPGRYTFQVKVRNHYGVEGEPRVLGITILPPWYRTTWAYALWLILTLATLYSFYRYQLRRRLAIAEAKRLKEMDLAKTQLYTNITHEFRTPLTVILGMTEQVKGDPKNWFHEGLRLIGRNGKHLLHLVNQLLDLSKLESDSMPLNLVYGDVVSYLNYLCESFYSYADSKDIRLHFQTDLKELHMDHDPEKLQHIVSNLLSNAIKFTQAGGDVYVQLAVGKEQEAGSKEQGTKSKAQGAPRSLPFAPCLELVVRDNGFGIAPEHLPHIFDRFYQADASATRRGEGTGIGLALTKELVKVMGGSVEVESTVGKGTKFTIQLPITHTAQAQPISPAEPSEALLATALIERETSPAVQPVELSDRYTVLLVEDNQDVIAYLSSILSLYYRIETARNGQEGIEKALEFTPDLIVSDVMMPDTDGFELCQTLKTDERTSHIPIILLTAKADQAAKVEGLTYGADAYLTKPFHKEELLVRVEKLIEQRRKLQERYRQAGSLRPLLKARAKGLDDTFLQKVVRHIETHLADEEYGMPQLCKAMNVSRSNLFRKLKALTGKSATDLIRTIRLEKAKELLESTDQSVAEVCYAVGFTNPNYFSTMFKEAFGVSPSEMRKE